MVKFMKCNNYTKEINRKYKKVQKNEPFSFKWIAQMEVVIILVLLLFVLFFNLISDKSKFEAKYNLEKLFSQEYKNKNNMEYEELISSIDENKKLSDNEKSFMKKVLEKEIKENIEFIDLKKINKKFKNLEICYNDLDRTLNYNYEISKKVAGDYNIFSNKIFIYDFEENFNTSFDKIDFENKEIYFHELNHVLTDYTLSSTVDLFAKNIENKTNVLLETKILKEFSNDIVLLGKNTFTETVNELFTREYLGIYDENKVGLRTGKAYSEYMPYTYVLAEILDEETLKKYKFKDNSSIIINGLLEIDENFEEVYQLITSINLIEASKEKLAENQNSNNIYEDIYQSLSYFYEKKYNRKMDKDLVIISYLYDTKVLENKTKKCLEEFLDLKENDKIIDIIPKGYISEDYKKINNTVLIEYVKNDKKQIVELSDENRYL